MVIDITAAAGLSVEGITEKLEAGSVSALILDENLKIAYKTSSVSEVAVGFKIGSPISRFVSERDLHTLSCLAANESFCASFDTGYTRCGAVFIGCEACKIAVLSPFYADMLGCVDNEYERMSGYDITLGGNMKTEEAMAESADVRMQNMLKLLSETLAGLRNVHGLPFFNASAVVRSLIEATGSVRGINRDAFEVENASEEVYICGSQRNFALVIAAAVSFCVNRLSGGKISVAVSTTDSEATVEVSAALNASSYKTRTDQRFFENGKPFNVNMQDESFSMYLSKLLADANLWDINIESKNGKTVFSVSAPLLITGNELVVRDHVDLEIADILESVLMFFTE